MQYNWAGDYNTIEQEIMDLGYKSDKPDQEQGEAQTIAKFTYKGKDKQSNFLCSSFWRPSFRKPQRDRLMRK